MQRYFVDKNNINLPYIYITGDDCHHILNVMRMKIGEMVYISDRETSYKAVIQQMEKERITLIVEQELDEQKELPRNITIAHGLLSSFS